MWQIDNIDIHAIQDALNTFCKAVIEIDPGNTGGHLNAYRRKPHPDDAVFLQEHTRGYFRRIETEYPQNSFNTGCVFGIPVNPDINILRRPGITIVPDGIPANQEVSDLMLVEQSQEFFEVERKLHCHSLSCVKFQYGGSVPKACGKARKPFHPAPWPMNPP